MLKALAAMPLIAQQAAKLQLQPEKLIEANEYTQPPAGLFLRTFGVEEMESGGYLVPEEFVDALEYYSIGYRNGHKLVAPRVKKALQAKYHK